MKNKFIRIIVILLCVLFLIVLGFLYIAHEINHASPVVIHQTAQTDVNSEDLSITLPSSKGWKESAGIRATQFDATIYNNKSYAFENWTVRIELPEKAKINDYWSCEIVENADGTVTFSGLDYNYDIPTDENVTFGFILFAKDEPVFDTFQIEATPNYVFTDFKLFYVLCFLLILWLVCVATTFSLWFSTNQYRLRLATDHKIILQSMKTFTNFIDAKDPYTKGHSSRVAYYSRLIASKMNFTEEQLDSIYYIALLHDVGKISIADDILNKKAKLTDDERSSIETHTTQGSAMLKDFTAIPDIIEGALYHHERYDGNGYPHGLSGEEIPLIARIICVADSFDAMNSTRCYRNALSMEAIIAELTVNSGLQFDPAIVDIMLDLIKTSQVPISD